MKFTAQQIAEILEGTIVGNPLEEVSTLSKIEEGEKGSLTFLSNPKYNSYIYSTKASITIVDEGFEPEKEIATTLIKVADSYSAFSKLLAFYEQAKNEKLGRENPHFIGDGFSIGANEYIGAFTYIGNNVSIGENVKIYPNAFIDDNVTIGDDCKILVGAKIHSDSVIGNNCVIHAGAIIGCDGFGFAPSKEGVYSKIPQIGNVIIEDNVDVGAATTIDRATLGSTIIKKGVKLDNHIQIAHNVIIGENTVIAAQCGIAGSTKIGKNCMIGGQVGIVGHITVGDNVKVLAGSGVIKSVKDNEMIKGTPAFAYNDFNKSYVYFKKLPEMAVTINKLEKNIKTQNE